MAETPRWITLHFNAMPRRVRADEIVEYGAHALRKSSWYQRRGDVEVHECDETVAQLAALIEVSPRSGADTEAPNE